MSRFLLDTHTALWWWTDPAPLGSAALATLTAGQVELYVSVASVWEIAIKTQSGKLTMIENFERDYRGLMRANEFRSLSVTDDHALKAGFLVSGHRDPFDRLIAAQAIMEDMTVITRDPAIAKLGCTVIW